VLEDILIVKMVKNLKYYVTKSCYIENSHLMSKLFLSKKEKRKQRKVKARKIHYFNYFKGVPKNSETERE
jgi:hypothetical protein